MARERRKFQVDDGKTRERKHSMGGRASFVVPPGLSMWRPKEQDGGAHTIDIIAFNVTAEHLRFRQEIQYSKPGYWYGERTFFAHRKIGINEETFTCLSKTFGVKCPICDARAVFLERPDTESQDRAKELKTSERQLFLIYDHDDAEKGIQLWEISWWNFGKHLDHFIRTARKSNRDAYQRYYDPVDGLTMRLGIRKESIGDGTNTIYTVTEFFRREKPFPEEFFDHGYDLDSMIRQLDYDTLKGIYTGTTEPDQDEDSHEDQQPDDDSRSHSSANGDGHDSRSPPPERKEDYIFATNDIVSFEFKGEQVTGEIKKVNLDTKMAEIKIPDREAPVRMEFSDLTLEKSDDTFDRKDATPGGNKPGWDESDDGRSFQRPKSQPTQTAKPTVPENYASPPKKRK